MPQKGKKSWWPVISPLTAEPHSSVSSVADLRTRGRWFDPQLGQYSFARINDSHCDRIHSCLTAASCFDNGYVWKQPVLWKEYCAVYSLKELQESTDRCTGRSERTQILLKTALKTIQSINLYLQECFYPIGELISSFTLFSKWISANAFHLTLFQRTKFQDLSKIQRTCRWQNKCEGLKNIRGEKAGYQHFLFFIQCFHKTSFSRLLNVRIVW